jgi:hypothetical protein
MGRAPLLCSRINTHNFERINDKYINPERKKQCLNPRRKCKALLNEDGTFMKCISQGEEEDSRNVVVSKRDVSIIDENDLSINNFKKVQIPKLRSRWTQGHHLSSFIKSLKYYLKLFNKDQNHSFEYFTKRHGIVGRITLENIVDIANTYEMCILLYSFDYKKQWLLVKGTNCDISNTAAIFIENDSFGVLTTKKYASVGKPPELVGNTKQYLPKPTKIESLNIRNTLNSSSSSNNSSSMSIIDSNALAKELEEEENKTKTNRNNKRYTELMKSRIKSPIVKTFDRNLRGIDNLVDVVKQRNEQPDSLFMEDILNDIDKLTAKRVSENTTSTRNKNTVASKKSNTRTRNSDGRKNTRVMSSISKLPTSKQTNSKDEDKVRSNAQKKAKLLLGNLKQRTVKRNARQSQNSSQNNKSPKSSKISNTEEDVNTEREKKREEIRNKFGFKLQPRVSPPIKKQSPQKRKSPKAPPPIPMTEQIQQPLPPSSTIKSSKIANLIAQFNNN